METAVSPIELASARLCHAIEQSDAQCALTDRGSPRMALADYPRVRLAYACLRGFPPTRGTSQRYPVAAAKRLKIFSPAFTFCLESPAKDRFPPS
jgi:hypothetical protein